MEVLAGPGATCVPNMQRVELVQRSANAAEKTMLDTVADSNMQGQHTRSENCGPLWTSVLAIAATIDSNHADPKLRGQRSGSSQ